MGRCHLFSLTGEALETHKAMTKAVALAVLMLAAVSSSAHAQYQIPIVSWAARAFVGGLLGGAGHVLGANAMENAIGSKSQTPAPSYSPPSPRQYNLSDPCGPNGIYKSCGSKPRTDEEYIREANRIYGGIEDGNRSNSTARRCWTGPYGLQCESDIDIAKRIYKDF
jgi:hypothetical protein